MIKDDSVSAELPEAKALRCEICGTELSEEGVMVEVDGARLLVCEGCKRFGGEIKRSSNKPRVSPSKPASKIPDKVSELAKIKPVREKIARAESSESDLVEDYPQQIRRARESLKLTQVELAKRIGERLSIIQKLETGKMRPTDTLVERIYRVLHITLRAPIEEELATHHYPKPNVELTIGDIAKRVEKKKDD